MIIIPLLFMIIIFYQLKLNKSNFFSLSIIFTIYWAVLSSLGILFFYNKHVFSLNTFIWIILCCLFFYFAEKLLEIYLNNNNHSNVNITLGDFNISFIFYIIIIFFMIRIIGSIFFLFINGINIFDFFSLSGLSYNIDILTKIRYGLIPSINPIMLSIGNLLSYVGLLLMGYYFMSFKKVQKYFLIFLSVISTMIYTIISMGKASIIYSIIIFLSSFITSLSIYDSKGVLKKIYNKRYIFLIIFLFVFIFIVFAILILIRGDTNNLYETFINYGFGEIPAFDFYFNNVSNELSLGKYTFYGFWSIIFGADPNLTQGIYHLTDVGGLTTNVFTAFRSVIDDFGKLFGILFFSLLGLLSAYSKYSIKRRKILFIFVPLHSYILAFILESYVISIGNFFSLSFSFIIFSLILYLNNIKISDNVVRKIMSHYKGKKK